MNAARIQGLRARLTAFREYWASEKGGHGAFESGVTVARAGLYNTRQLSPHAGGARLGTGARLTMFEGARLNDLQVLGVAELPHRDRRRVSTGRRGGGGDVFDNLEPRLAAKAAYARGAQPAFFKIISGAAGRARVGALFAYLGTREDPSRTGERVDIDIVASDGRVARSARDREALLDEWSDLFGRTPRGRDVHRIALGVVSATPLTPAAARSLVAEALEGRRFVYAVRDQGEGHYTLTVAVASTAADRRAMSGQEFARHVHDAFDDTARARGVDLRFSRREASGRAFAGVKRQLDRFADGDFGLAYDRHGFPLEASDMRQEASAWAKDIGRACPNDVLHTVFSARPGTDREAFRKAVVATLDERFGGYRFAVALHDDKRHVHLHAVIQTRNAAGERVRVDKAELHRIRTTLAARARENGIDMVHVSRDDRAAAPSRSQAVPSEDRAGRADGAVRGRRAAGTADEPSPAASAGQARRRAAARAEWREVAGHFETADHADPKAAAFAREMVARHDRAASLQRKPKLSPSQLADLIFSEAKDAMDDAANLTALQRSTARAIERIDRLAALSQPDDAARLREQSKELHRIAEAHADLMRAQASEQAAVQAARAADVSATGGSRQAQMEVSRQAEALRRATKVAEKTESSQAIEARAAEVTDTQDVRERAEQQRRAARKALEQAERDGATVEEISRRRAAYGKTLRPVQDVARDDSLER